MKGRRPKPTALLRLQGTFHPTHHAHRALEPVAHGDLSPEPPDWLSDSQRDGWRYAVENAPRGLLKRIDATALLTWVLAEDRQRLAAAAQNILDADNPLPLLRAQRDGSLAVSAYVGILNRTALVLMKAVQELGFSPASRPRIMLESAGVNPEPSPWDRFSIIEGGRDDEPEDDAG